MSLHYQEPDIPQNIFIRVDPLLNVANNPQFMYKISPFTKTVNLSVDRLPSVYKILEKY